MTSGFEQVGKVIKVHGLKGELIIEPNVAEPTQLESIEVFYVKNKRGDVEPYRVEQSKIIEKK